MSARKKRVRDAFRQACFERDNHCCAVCSAVSANLDAHHITDRNELPNGGYVQENGIALCEECHLKAEEFHCTGRPAEGFHPDDLYRIIGSSKEAAIEASRRP